MLVWTIFLVWILCLGAVILSRGKLLLRTWQEPYLSDQVVVIESDDWGSGGVEQSYALDGLLAVLAQHRDRENRRAILTANLVLAMPDSESMKANGYSKYRQLVLKDIFPQLFSTLMAGMKEELILPQLHGKEHLYPPGIIRLARSGDQNTVTWLNRGNEKDVQALPHHLQAHYVDGTRLPSASLPYFQQQKMVDMALSLFHDHFGFESTSTVAPCYLWDDQTETSWHRRGVRFIQTAGYRCTSLDEKGHYIQNPKIIRFGERNGLGQLYLLRTAMYEPADRKNAEAVCMRGVTSAFRQCLPAVICTHAYNYYGKRAIQDEARAGLDRVLENVCRRYSEVKFMTSPELGAGTEKIMGNSSSCTPEPGRAELEAAPITMKTQAFLIRLWYRHIKLRVFAMVSLLIVPALLTILICHFITITFDAHEKQC